MDKKTAKRKYRDHATRIGRARTVGLKGLARAGGQASLDPSGRN
jgi:hypothetical protein